METVVTFDEFSFAFDPAGEEIEALGHDLDTLAEHESPLGTIEDVWEDKALRKRFPDALDKVGESDASTLLGRLTSLFGSVALEENEIEGMGFRAPMVAHPAGRSDEPLAVVMAFDYFASARLAVIPLSKDEELTEAVAREFWSIIFEDLDTLEDESVRVYNSEEGVWHWYGVSNGAVFYQEEEPDPEEIEEFEDEPYGQDGYDDEEEY